MVAFYKHDISAWMDGTEGLSDGAYRVYHVVIQLIMLAEGPITLNERGIAGRCNRTVGAFRKALNELLEARKLSLRDGKLWNLRAEMELESVRKNRENAGKGGKTRAFRQETQENDSGRPAKALQNNEVPQAPLNNVPSLKEKRREDTPKAPKGAEPEGFAEWWEAYPKRDGVNPRAAAAARYAQAVKAGVTPETLLLAVRAYAAELQRTGKANTEFVKQAQFWLSPKDRHWEDYARKAQAQTDRQAGAAPGGSDYIASITDDRWRAHLRNWKSRVGDWPLQKMGCPPPDAPNTKVPRLILAEFGLLSRSQLVAA